MNKNIRIIIIISLIFLVAILLAVPLFSDSKHYSDINRLKGSSSPYLLQHADNPVHWLPWGDEAFEEARRLNRPILVSIGYSTCHWCHVMEHESFEDTSTASIMNDLLITIKVDREQLPGVDSFYMEAASLMGSSTGWPLNVFIDHEGNPFYAGTYYPTDVWQSLIRRVDELWTDERSKLHDSGNALTNAVRRYSEQAAGIPSVSKFTKKESDTVISSYIESLYSRFDEEYPGFPSSGGTQFPPTSTLSFILEHDDARGREMAEKILETMQNSGLHDRVGGGFHRYTVDRAWRIPHFEKMLYDNVQLMAIYSQASVLFERDDFLQTAISIGDYLLRDMKIENKSGKSLGFATAEDADDPVGEGAFYAWSIKELRELLPKDIAIELIRLWDITTLSREKDSMSGSIPYPLGGTSNKVKLEDSSFRSILFDAREKRPRPSRDSKVLTDLNALALQGFSVLARVSGEPRFFQAVKDQSTFLVERYHSHGLIRLPGISPYITDYAYMILGLTAAYPILEDPGLVELAMEIASSAIEDLSTGLGSFYSTPADSLNLPVRKVDSFDTQIPSGLNSLALGFARIYSITGNLEYKNMVEKVIGSQITLLTSYPGAYSTLLRANLLLGRKWHIVLAGNSEMSIYEQLKTRLLSSLGSDYPIITAKGTGNESWVLLQDRKNLVKPQVLICNDRSCLLPVYSVADLDRRLIEAGIFP